MNYTPPLNRILSQTQRTGEVDINPLGLPESIWDLVTIFSMIGLLNDASRKEVKNYVVDVFHDQIERTKHISRERRVIEHSVRIPVKNITQVESRPFVYED